MQAHPVVTALAEPASQRGTAVESVVVIIQVIILRALALRVIITTTIGFIIRIFSIIREGVLKFGVDSQLIGLVRL